MNNSHNSKSLTPQSELQSAQAFCLLGNDTEVGKTVVGAILATLFRRQGLNVGVMMLAIICGLFMASKMAAGA